MPLPRAVFLVRHGETTWSAQRRHTGRTDLELTATGEDEARAAGRALLRVLGDDEPTMLFTSPLVRARRTAELALEPAWRHRLVVSDLVAEWDYGDYEGLTTAEITAARPGWELWRDGCPHGESPAEVIGRATAFVEEITSVTEDEVVVVFTHGHMSRALASRLLGLGAGFAAVLHNDTASIGVIRSRDDRLALAGWNLPPG